MNTSWPTLTQEVYSCEKCRLCQNRHNVVLGEGDLHAKLMFVGEGPGQQEDLSGEPFVGAAGKLLDEMLNIIDLNRYNCYITNIVKCRPPHNRDPLPQEQEACIGYLKKQLELIQPKIIVCLGRIAAQRLIKEDFRITREHGTWFDKDGVQYMAMYHPSALLRDLNKRPETFSDLLLLRKMAIALDCMPEVKP